MFIDKLKNPPMKSFPLLSFLRNSFLFLEWTSAIFAVFTIICSLIISPYVLSTPGLKFYTPIYRLQFEPQPSLPPMAYHGAGGGTVALRNVSGTLMVQQTANSGTLLTFVRLRAAYDCLRLILACAIFSLLRQLFDNVKLGEAFSLKSVQLIRRIGWCFAGYAVAASLFASVLDWMIGHDLRQHLTLDHLRTDFVSADAIGGLHFVFNELHLTLDLTIVGVALLGFVLAEVFRQGVLLQQDHDLTV